MIEIGIVGAKNSGKTTLIEALIPKFAESGLNLKIATIKHTGHKHSFDLPGKDSFRHRQAGAELTMAVSQGEFALYGQAEKETEAIARELISRRFDLCLVEGNKQADRPKVLLTRNIESLKHEVPSGIIASYGPTRHSEDLDHFALDNISGLSGYLLQRFFSEQAEQTEPQSKGSSHE